ncbi:MAG: SPOR domain-containing protein [Mariprofundus sp.]|nr:SPOR domain-containing protein [Mariprofundus sp.]
MSADNSDRNKQEQSCEQADADQAAYLDSLIAQFSDDFENDKGCLQPLASGEPELTDLPISEQEEFLLLSTAPAMAGTSETATSPTKILLTGFVTLIILVTAIWWLTLKGDVHNTHTIINISQPIAMTSTLQTAPAAPAIKAPQTTPTVITPPKNSQVQATATDQLREPATVPQQSKEPAIAPDQTAEPATAQKQSDEPAITADQLAEPEPVAQQTGEAAVAPDQIVEPETVVQQSQEPTVAPEQSKPLASTTEQKKTQSLKQTIPSPTTILHLDIDPISRKVIALQPANTRMAWTVNLASVSSLAIAEKVRESLDNRGVATELIWVTIGKKSFYRIRIPGFSSKRAANQARLAYIKNPEFSSAWLENYYPQP